MIVHHEYFLPSIHMLHHSHHPNEPGIVVLLQLLNEQKALLPLPLVYLLIRRIRACYKGMYSSYAFYQDRSRQSKQHLSESARSEEHTSELQSRENLVCRLLLEKKKQK